VRYAARFLFVCTDKKRIVLQGGLVYTPQVAKEVYDWATQSFFTFDDTQVQLERKQFKPFGIHFENSVVWVIRMLSQTDIQKLVTSKSITVWVNSDNTAAKTGTADINNSKNQIISFIKNCY
jgi:hypothetical protein